MAGRMARRVLAGVFQNDLIPVNFIRPGFFISVVVSVFRNFDSSERHDQLVSLNGFFGQQVKTSRNHLSRPKGGLRHGQFDGTSARISGRSKRRHQGGLK